jgi:hypothetical protein
VFTALLIIFFWVPLWRRVRGGGHTWNVPKAFQQQYEAIPKAGAEAASARGSESLRRILER